MEATFTGSKRIRRDGKEYSAEVTIRFLPSRDSTGLGYSSDAERYLNSIPEDELSELSGPAWYSVVNALQAGESRLAKWPEVGAKTFRAEVVHVRATEGASPKEVSLLIAEAGRMAAESYLAALDDGRVQLVPGDAEKPFAYQPSTGFDEEYIARRQCFLEYVAEKRPGFLTLFRVAQHMSIEEQSGVSAFSDVVFGYLCGCRPEADTLVAKSYEILTRADLPDEQSEGDCRNDFELGHRYIALAYINWLRTGEPDDDAKARATRHLLTYYRHTKDFDRGSANLEAPALLFAGAETVLFAMAERLAARPGRGATPPGGLFGDALKIAKAKGAERDRLKDKLRKRMPSQLFKWINHGSYANVAYLLHAVFPRPDGPPSRLIERAWDVMPEIERRPAGYLGWDVAKAKKHVKQ